MSSIKRSVQEQAIYDSLVYPGGDVLRNKAGITNQATLDNFEARAVALREPTRPIFKKFTLAEMKAVHKHLLEKAYDWAGELRTYTTGRNIASFAKPEYIESYFETAVLKPLQRENFLKGTNSEQFAERGAYFACEVNAVHPFIDGNGRVTRLFLKDLAAQAGYHLDITHLEANKGAWYEAMKLGFERADLSKLKQEILNALNFPEKTLEKRLETQPSILAERGRIYEGEIVGADKGRVLQQTACGVVAHERRELSGKNLDFESLQKSGQAVSIEYGKYAKIGMVREGNGRQKQGIGKAEPALKGRGLEKY